MAGAFTLLFVTLVLAAMRNEILRRRVRTLQLHAGERRELTMETTAHIDFIAAAYAAAVIVVGALIAWVTLDYRAQTRKIAELEMQGITRRSDAGFGSADAAGRRRRQGNRPRNKHERRGKSEAARCAGVAFWCWCRSAFSSGSWSCF